MSGFNWLGFAEPSAMQTISQISGTSIPERRSSLDIGLDLELQWTALCAASRSTAKTRRGQWPPIPTGSAGHRMMTTAGVLLVDLLARRELHLLAGRLIGSCQLIWLSPFVCAVVCADCRIRRTTAGHERPLKGCHLRSAGYRRAFSDHGR
jgi:hypothetical protein